MGKVEAFSTANIIKLFYLVVPAIFYSLPFLFYSSDGELVTHYQYTLYSQYTVGIITLTGHLLLGIGVILCLSSTTYIITRLPAKSTHYFLTVFSTLGVATLPNGALIKLSFAIMVILLANFRFNSSLYVALIFIALCNLIINSERYLVAMITISWLVPYLSKLRISRLIIYGGLAALVLIYILQPLRYSQLPFSAFSSFTEAKQYFLQHLQPIYYASYLIFELDHTTKELLIEFIPFAKSITGHGGIVEKLAQAGISNELFSAGARVGSNSSLYFSLFGAVLLALMLAILGTALKVFNDRLFVNSVCLYFILYGPYFIRRTFASYMVDLVAIIFLCAAACALKLLSKWIRRSSKEFALV